MAPEILASTFFRANLGVLDRDAADIFIKWAGTNCSQHIVREEGNSTMLYAGRENSRTAQQIKNTLRALASNKKIQLNTENSFVTLLGAEEYNKAIAQKAIEAGLPGHKDRTRATCGSTCRGEYRLELLPEGFELRSKELYEALLAADDWNSK